MKKKVRLRCLLGRKSAASLLRMTQPWHFDLDVAELSADEVLRQLDMASLDNGKMIDCSV